ncbi:uncharacterized protein BO87DRAFT_391582 [Aspergillus neoniger CBS 115656]|uniref:Uncharacterized protein n=1 Tax=Aspergillus neoniger (strain CBS 115656) TaxID=1448310 RepID=A0A318Y3B3_ASPNB|nr:hypothetical protein BO87DRAFT_391582 [Aspergillus neoniger CBS 115656]PYH28815.1 hypothetical protein BO87DRAFT_391582 [Aspergillus neoniger CBS 115656]
MVSTVGRPAHIQFARNGTRGRHVSSRPPTSGLTIEDALAPITSTAAKTRKKRQIATFIYAGLLAASLVADILALLFLTRPSVQQAGVATLHCNTVQQLSWDITNRVSQLNGEGLLLKRGKKAYTMGETYVTATSARIDDNTAEITTAASNVPLLTATTAPDRPGFLTSDTNGSDWISIGTQALCFQSGPSSRVCHPLPANLSIILPPSMQLVLGDSVSQLQDFERSAAVTARRGARSVMAIGLVLISVAVTLVLIFSWWSWAYVHRVKWLMMAVASLCGLLLTICFKSELMEQFSRRSGTGN